jgi:peptidylprolyl isomerase
MRRPLSLALVSALLIAGCSHQDESTAAAPDTVPEITAVDCGVPAPEREIPSVTPPATLPTELVVEDVRTGSGRAAQTGDTLFVDYVGIRSEDGAVVDASYQRDTPQNFTLGSGAVIAGWDQGLIGVQTGALRRLDVPAALAYGDNPPQGLIRPGDALTFVIEVRAVFPPTTADDAPLGIDVEPSVGATAVGVTDLVVGSGPAARLGNTVLIHALFVRGDNKVVLLNTWERSSPLEIELSTTGGAIPGLIQGLQCGALGGRREIILPPEWAFGPDGEPSLGLPANTDLIVIADIFGLY